MTTGQASLDSSAGTPAKWQLGIPTLLLAISAGICVQVLVLLTVSGGDPVDALSYWQTDPANPYPMDKKEFQFGYSPVIAQIWAPLFQLPFEVFAFLFRLVEVVGLLILTGPLAGAFIFTTPMASEVNAANINMLLGVVMVLGFRWPALWAIALLTKPSMGIGLLWFVLRGEWRKAAIPIAIAGALSLVSFVFDPRLWFQWVEWVQHGTAQVGEWPYPYPIQVRLPIALLIVVWAARTNRPWGVVLASALALPRLYFMSPAILVALVPLIPWLGRLVVPWTRRLSRVDELYPDRRASASAGVALDRRTSAGAT
jgi:hypothetical protein